jgi:hypothetical protein
MTTLLKTIIEPCFISELETVWADSSLVLAMVKKQLANLNQVGNDNSDIVLGCWNAKHIIFLIRIKK